MVHQPELCSLRPRGSFLCFQESLTWFMKMHQNNKRLKPHSFGGMCSRYVFCFYHCKAVQLRKSRKKQQKKPIFSLMSAKVRRDRGLRSWQQKVGRGLFVCCFYYLTPPSTMSSMPAWNCGCSVWKVRLRPVWSGSGSGCA